MKRYLPFLLIALVLIVAVAAGVMLRRRPAQTSGASIPADLATRPLTVGNTPPPSSPQPGAEPPRVKWQASSPVVLEEFGDYQCPPCGALHHELEKVAPVYGRRVRLIFRHYPLTNMHENAMDAARAAEAAGLQGRFWQMHDLLYQNQSKWSKEKNARQIFSEYARSLGLDLARFEQDRDSLQVNMRIQRDMGRGDSLGVRGTPTIYLNGRELTLNAAGDLQKALDLALQEKGQ